MGAGGVRRHPGGRERLELTLKDAAEAAAVAAVSMAD